MGWTGKGLAAIAVAGLCACAAPDRDVAGRSQGLSTKAAEPDVRDPGDLLRSVNRARLTRRQQQAMDRAVAELESDVRVQRYRFVEMEPSDLHQRKTELVMRPFADTRLRFARRRSFAHEPGYYTWVGERWDGQDVGLVMIHGNRILARLWWDESMYRVREAGGGIYAVAELDLALEQGSTLAAHRDDGFTAERPEGIEPKGEVAIDVLGAYTADARAAAAPWFQKSNPEHIRDEIQLAVDLANVALENGGHRHRVVLVGTHEVWGAPDDGKWLDWLGGRMQDTNTRLRKRMDALDADVASLWVKELGGDRCGVATYPDHDAADRWLLGRHVVQLKHCEDHVFPHELGHNLGAGHDPWVGSSAPHSYAHGFIVTERPRWRRTIMAYSDLCASNTRFCRRIPYYSGPDNVWDGYVLGGYGPNGLPADFDNTRAIDDWAPLVGNYAYHRQN